MEITIKKVEEVLENLIADYEADIEGCSEDELLRYNGAIEGLQQGIFRIRILK